MCTRVSYEKEEGKEEGKEADGHARVRTPPTGTLGVDRVRLEEEYDGETDETARRLRLRTTETEDEKVPLEPASAPRLSWLGLASAAG